MKPILFVIDIQKEYVTAGRPFCIDSIGESLNQAKRVLDHARDYNWEVIHVKHLQDGNIFSASSPFSDYVTGFHPLANETEIIKNNFSAFSSEKMRDLIPSFGNRPIYVIGYGSTMCCLSTIVDGYHRGLSMNFVTDASYAKKACSFSEQDLHARACAIIQTFAKNWFAQDVIDL